MAMFNVKTTVEYYFEVEAETEDDAMEMGWDYENHGAYRGEVYSIEVDEVEEEDAEEDE